MTVPPPFGPGFSQDLAENAEKMELWGTTYGDPGPDYCEFRLFKNGVRIATQRIDGY